MPRQTTRFLVLVLLAVTTAFGASPELAPVAKPHNDYYELYKLLVDSMDQIERHYVKEVDRRELIESAIKGVLAKLDPYSAYISPKEIATFRAGIESEFGGIGIQITVEEGQVKVISPLVGSPAYKAGVMAGDRIMEINGKSTAGATIDEATEGLKGATGTSVVLTVIHPGRSNRELITVTRERIHIDTVLGDHRHADGSWDFLCDSDKRIGYVRVTGFSRDTARELRKACEDLQEKKMRAMILDLRFNPGGLLGAAVDVANLFIRSGTIVSTVGRASPERIWEARGEGKFADIPMVVLINRYSASASEIVAACLQDHQRAVVIGERSWGKGSVQNVIELEDGRSALKLTTAAYRRPSGKNIHRFEDSKESDAWGVMPDEGFEVKLGDSETIGLLQDRRRRDSVHQPAAVDAGGKSGGESPPATTSDLKTADPGNLSDNRGRLGMIEGRDEGSRIGSKSDPREFIDRQFDKAVQYLTDALNKAK